ncbi:MAG: DNA mismatch repair protein MutS [Holosporales bacterium]|jgi:DNA mismatch repair protein MutS|nr:DNA mismatch repair protein MutS [Holosporales bacterium]
MPTDNEATSPIIRQYIDIKNKHKDCLLFYRMGDFFEMFFDDAVVTSKELDITLTKRGKQAGQDIPMCGVPVNSFELYLAKLIQKGYKVAICDQIETPEQAKERGGKGPLQRDIVRIVTTGTITEEELLSAEPNYIMAISIISKGKFSAAIADISTGFFGIESFFLSELNNVLARWNPAEIIISDETFSEFMQNFEGLKKKLALLPKARFNNTNAKNLLESIYNVKTLDVFCKMNTAEIQAAGVLVDYITTTQCNKNISLLAPKIICSNEFMAIDAATRRNLEISSTQSENGMSLFSALNKTVTTVGRRLLQSWIISPLLDIEKIEERFNKIDFFLKKSQIESKIREILSKLPDVERIISRITLNRATPKDLQSLKIALNKADLAGKVLLNEKTEQRWISNLSSHTHLIDLLDSILNEEVPALTRNGNFIKDSFDEKLRHYRYLLNNSSESLAKIQEQYIQQTGINNLRIGRNSVWGIYIEVSSGQVSKVPYNFVHRQTLTNCTRYITPELVDLEKSINDAEKLAYLREIELFNMICQEVLSFKESLIELSKVIAEIDLFASMAYLARKNNYVRPELSSYQTIEIEGGRHPIVELAFQSNERSFTANNCYLDKEKRQFLIVTGPNMAGKSTYLRQNVLIIIMAQAGLFVPATRAKIGIVDRIFSRIGSSDDIASGKSTFMVEMIETAAILHQATDKSFVILDEIGRGTATYDGLSIAWAVSEYLYNNIGCRTIFATHYHEITELTKKLPAMVAVTAEIQEWENKIIFLHKIVDGVAKRSYGIHVAQLAGLPKAVILRATELLNFFEKEVRNEPKPQKMAKILEKSNETQKKLF